MANFTFDYSKEWNPNDIVKTVSDSELEFTPGKSFSYSNTVSIPGSLGVLSGFL